MTSLKEEINKRILQGDPKHTINRANEEDGEGTARNGGASDVGEPQEAVRLHGHVQPHSASNSERPHTCLLHCHPFLMIFIFEFVFRK